MRISGEALPLREVYTAERTGPSPSSPPIGVHQGIWGCLSPVGTQYLFYRLVLGVRYEMWAEEVAQYVKEIAAKPDDLSSIPGIHMVRENQLPQVAFCAPHTVTYK